jgi:diphosphomevalonate decarboxylase
MLVAVMSREEKEVSSRDGMRTTVETSPYYPAWIEDAEREVPRAIELVANRDLQGLGELCERNAWRMHATAMGANPPICYLLPKTLLLINALRPIRERGVRAWFTLDAGPNPVILTDANSEEKVIETAKACGVLDLVRCRPGGDTVLVDEHLA